MVEVKNLTKSYPGASQPAVNKISFKVEKGEIAAIIGTSGCGKSTTLKMINRLIEPSSGEVNIFDKNIQTVDPISWRREIGYVIQGAGLLPHLSIKKNISLLASVLKKDKSYINSRVNELMEIINLDPKEFNDLFPVQLSGGQQQRVGIARALMENPPLLLMDEPFGALDPITRSSLHEEFLALNKKLEKTIIIVTHDIDEAFKLANKIIIMDKGEIVQIGNEKELKENPANQFVKDFIGGKH